MWFVRASVMLLTAYTLLLMPCPRLLLLAPLPVSMPKPSHSSHSLRTRSLTHASH